MKSLREMYCALIAGLVLIPAAYGAVLVPPQGATAPDSWSSCTTCTTLGSGIFSTGSTGPSLGFVYSAAIFTNDPMNPYGLNDLDFVYSILDNATSTANISRIAAANFTGFNTDVGYFTATAFPGGTILPATVDRSTTNSVGFNFNSFGPGAESLVLVIKTNATTFSSGSLTVVDSGGSSASVTAFAPVVPEPELGWPLGFSLLGMAVYWRRRASSGAFDKSRL